MNVINDTKADKNRENIKNNLLSVVKNVQNNNDNVLFVLACTELSLYLNDVKEIALVIDAMDCLVNSAILKCGYKLK
jgi:aspartate/glutamate racemase